jgi:hypothetical protein
VYANADEVGPRRERKRKHMSKIRETQGGAYEARGKLFIRVSIAPRTRMAQHAPWATSLEAASARGKVVQAWVNRLRVAAQDDFIEKIVELGAAATEDELALLATKVEALTSGAFDRVEPLKAKGSRTTFEDFATKWVRGELSAAYPDHVERKRSAYTDLCIMRKYVFPVVGGLALEDVTLEHYERVMREIPTRAGSRKLRSATRRHVAQVMRRVMQLAEYPAKLVTHNPIPANAMPRVRTEVALQYVYPTRTRRYSAARRPTSGTGCCLAFFPAPAGAAKRRSGARWKGWMMPRRTTSRRLATSLPSRGDAST